MNRFDNRIFWVSQYMMVTVWVVFAVIGLLSFSITNFTVCFVGIVLSATNLTGYIKCDKQHQKNMGNFIMRKAKDNLSPEQTVKVGMMAARQSAQM